MRRFLTVLAASAAIAAPALSVAKNPFDFSDWVRKSRNEPSTVEDAPSSADQVPVADSDMVSGEQPISTELKNYSQELFGVPAGQLPPPRAAARPATLPAALPRPTSTEVPATGSAGRPRLPDRPQSNIRITREDLHRRDSGDTLKRFDEFLKERTDEEVVNASFDESQTPVPAQKIEPVARELPAEAWDADSESELPSKEDLKTSEATSEATGAKESPFEGFSFTEEKSHADSLDDGRQGSPLPGEPTGSRLTESIPTTPPAAAANPTLDQSPEVNSAGADIPTRSDDSHKKLKRNPLAEPTEKPRNPFADPEPQPIEAAAELESATPWADVPEPPAQKSDRVSVSKSTKIPKRVAAKDPASAPAASPGGIEAAFSQSRTASMSAVWTLKGPLNVGQECSCELVVTNHCKSVVGHVSVDAELPATVRILRSEPAFAERSGALCWDLDEMQAGEQQTIQVVLVADAAGPVELTSFIYHSDAQSQSLTVAQPQLSVVIDGPTDVTVGEPATQTVTVRNPGSGVATNVKLEAEVPEGLEHVRGNRLLMDMGSLNPGETRQVRLALAAVGGGPQILQVEARADAGLVQTASAEVNVVAPLLTANIDGPGLRYLGREATYVLRVQNDGKAATDAVQVVYRVPDGFDFVSADRGAQFDSTTRMLTWFVGRLGANQPQDLQVVLLATKPGEYVQAIRATSEHGTYCDAQLSTRVEGTPSLVIEVEDLDDPVEVGVETAYEVIVLNEGTASSQDVTLACELPTGLKLLRVDGPSAHRVQQNAIQFQSIPEVAPGETLVYRLFVQGAAPGDKRLRCRLTSAHLSQPLFTEEVTKFYQE